MKISVKYKVIYRHRKEYPISEMCRFFEVSRSGYYGYVSRMDALAKDLPLAEKIRVSGREPEHIWIPQSVYLA